MATSNVDRKPGSEANKVFRDKDTAKKIHDSLKNNLEQSERELAMKFKKSQSFDGNVKKCYNTLYKPPILTYS